jgi:PIN domain nuclease of toxin-antitoxin system
VTRPILLDTCALLWLADDRGLSASALAELAQVEDVAGGIVVSPISAWEIGQLASRGRLILSLDPKDWFQRALEIGFTLAPLSTDVLIASSYLPLSRLRDPADKILAATARTFRYRLMTRDRPLLEFGAAGHLEAIAC